MKVFISVDMEGVSGITHACVGTEGGVLNHTMLGKEIQNIYLNGEPTGETRLQVGQKAIYG